MKGKFFEVESGGRVELYGNHPRHMWGRLRQTAEAGAYTLYVLGQMDWQVCASSVWLPKTAERALRGYAPWSDGLTGMR